MVEAQTIASIDLGLLAMIGIERGDSSVQAERMLERLLAYRVFPDQEGRMNLALREVEGGLLLVPQITLIADTQKGNRPSLSRAATPELGRALFEELVSCHEDLRRSSPCTTKPLDSRANTLLGGNQVAL